MSRWHDDPYYDDDPEPECEHQDAEINWEGDWECSCGHHWSATLAELEWRDERVRRYDKEMRKLERRQWWDDHFGWLAFWRPFVALWKRWRKRKEIDDDIPF